MRDEARHLSVRLLDEAAREIRQDRHGTSPPVARMLEVLEGRLFDPELDVAALLRWSGQRDKNMLTRFAAEVGRTPGTYISEKRLALAARLLRETQLKVWEIATEVGYASSHSFGRAFKIWSGDTAIAYRKAAATDEPEPQPENEPFDDDVLSRREIRRAIAGDLTAENAEALSDRLFGLGDLVRANYSDLSPPPESSRSTEQRMADELWRWIEPLPYSVQLRAVESQAPAYQTPVLFHHLCTVSIQAEEPHRAVRRSHLALACLSALYDRVDRENRFLLARALAVAGYAQSRAQDLDKAAVYLRLAREILDLDGEDAHPLVVAELRLYRGNLALARGDSATADDLLSRGIDLLHRVAEVVLEPMEDEAEEPSPEPSGGAAS